jgi:hypothetical protein
MRDPILVQDLHLDILELPLLFLAKVFLASSWEAFSKYLYTLALDFDLFCQDSYILVKTGKCFVSRPFGCLRGVFNLAEKAVKAHPLFYSAEYFCCMSLPRGGVIRSEFPMWLTRCAKMIASGLNRLP